MYTLKFLTCKIRIGVFVLITCTRTCIVSWVLPSFIVKSVSFPRYILHLSLNGKDPFTNLFPVKIHIQPTFTQPFSGNVHVNVYSININQLSKIKKNHVSYLHCFGQSLI